MHTTEPLTVPPRPRAVQDQGAPWRTAFVLSGLVPLLGLLWSPPQPAALFYSVYVALCLLRWVPLRGSAGLVFAALLTGALIETLQWLGAWARCATPGQMFHPQLAANLTLAFGFYLGGALAWALLFRRLRFSATEAFVISGIMGIAIARQGDILLDGLRSLPAGALVWGYVYVLYGCMAALPRRLSGPGRRRGVRLWWHYPLALATCTAGVLGGSWGWGWLVARLGDLPPLRPICQAPLW